MNKCLYCGKPVRNKYCNVSCQNRHQKRKPSKKSIEKMKQTKSSKWKIFEVNCFKCGQPFEIKEFNVNKPKKEKYFCSRSCANSRPKSLEARNKQSESAKRSEKVKKANERIAKEKMRKKLAGEDVKFGGRKKIKRIKTICKECGKPIIHKETEVRKFHKECWLKKSGGYKKGSSRGKCGWYKGYWCDSSWELAWVIYNLDHKIKFKRNKVGFEYKYKNKEHKFYPDFILNGKYIEIKNFWSKRLEAKLNYFPHEIDVLYKKDLKHIFEYVENVYSKDFINLYE